LYSALKLLAELFKSLQMGYCTRNFLVERKMSKSIVRSPIILLLILLLALSPFLLGYASNSRSSASGSVSSASDKAGSSAGYDFSKYAYFPREPRLGAIEPNSGFAQIGVASYGANGTSVDTDGVQGIATVNSASIGYFAATIVNNSIASSYTGSGNSTLQENAVAFLSNNLGYFWAQNVVFVSQTGSNTFSLQLINNIWNFNSPTANMSPGIISGSGTVDCFITSGTKSCFYYAYDPNTFTVKAPFTINLTMWIGQGKSGGASDISFNYDIHDSAGDNFSGTYDDAVLFPGTSKTNSFFLIGGESPYGGLLGGTTSLVLPNDLEFVWGGPGDGSAVFMNSFSGTEQLSIASGSSFVPASDVYSVGSDTGEEAAGIQVSPDLSNPSSPVAVLTSGYVNAVKLWPLPLSLGLSSVSRAGSLSFSGQLDYSADNGTSSASSATNITVNVITTSAQASGIVGATQAVSTNEEGGFAYTFTPNFGAGIFFLTFSYPGSPSYDAENKTETIAVSSIALSTVPIDSTLTALVNSSAVQVPVSGPDWFFAVANGTSESVSFQTASAYGASQRELFSGFAKPGSSQGLGPSVAMTGSNVQSVDATFVNQYNVTITNPISSTYVSKWYNQSQTISLSAPYTTSVSGEAYTFSAWVANGRVISTNPSQNVVATSPMVITAEYTTTGQSLFSGTNIAILAGFVALSLVVGLGIGMFLRRSKSSPSAASPAQSL
jgi:Thermopsin